MKTASCVFDEKARQRVQAAVAAAESRTSAEIVPVVATESGRYDRAEDIVGLVTGVSAMALVWTSFQAIDPDAAGWDGSPLVVGLPVLVLTVVVGFVVGVAVAMRVGWLRRLFTPRSEIDAEVMRQARSMFFDNRLHHTAGGTGLLVYVSLFERTAVILCDERALEVLTQPFLDDLCKQLTQEMARGQTGDAIANVIEAAAARLEIGLPRTKSDVNELPDALVVIN